MSGFGKTKKRAIRIFNAKYVQFQSRFIGGYWLVVSTGSSDAKETTSLSVSWYDFFLLLLVTVSLMFSKGIPVLVVKMHQLKRQKSIKEKGFSTFLLGTHPMLGEESPVLKLRGMYPILKVIKDYSQNQDEVQHDIEIVDEQIHELLW